MIETVKATWEALKLDWDLPYRLVAAGAAMCLIPMLTPTSRPGKVLADCLDVLGVRHGHVDGIFAWMHDPARAEGVGVLAALVAMAAIAGMVWNAFASIGVDSRAACTFWLGLFIAIEVPDRDQWPVVALGLAFVCYVFYRATQTFAFYGEVVARFFVAFIAAPLFPIMAALAWIIDRQPDGPDTNTQPFPAGGSY